MTDEELLKVLELWEQWLMESPIHQNDEYKEQIDELFRCWYEKRFKEKEVPSPDTPISMMFHSFIGAIEIYKKNLEN
ncbi:hypothetical protein P261_00452 [Lachnospiraceae bacterium TWA4]|nr:hypothetical protein P261_00452 [Lachnospiraceae bacterium TWA4]